MFSQGNAFIDSPPKSPNRPLQSTSSVMTDVADSSDSIAKSWNKFREILYTVDQDELEQRHAKLHIEDKMMHEELERRANSFQIADGNELEKDGYM
jgi:hypothetical protein